MLRDGGLDLVPTSGAVEKLRAVKDEAELEQLRRACAITDRVFERLTEVPFVGRTEREVSWELVRLFHEEGGAGRSRSSRSSAPGRPARGRTRAPATARSAPASSSSSTPARRSAATRPTTRARSRPGRSTAEAKEAYDTVLRAQQAALDGIRAGISGVDADALARGVIDESPFTGKLGHGLGHGLGLDVHEAPRLSTESSDILEPGNVVTVEPGDLPRGPFRHPDRGRRRRHRRRNREPDGLPQGPDRGRLGFPGSYRSTGEGKPL